MSETAEAVYGLLRRGQGLLAGGHVFQALVPLERARDLEPAKGSIREALGRAYYEAGRIRRARAEFAAAVEIDPVNDYAHFALAVCLERQGDMGKARGHAKIACAMRPDDDRYRRLLRRILRRSGTPG